MATPIKWSNVQVAVQSALAGSKTISAVTKANPGVASSTAHGYADGDYVLLTVAGMTQINARVARVTGAVTDSFSLEGIDTTLYDTFVSGTAKKITFGTTMATVTGLTSSGGDFPFISTTTIHDTQETQIPGLPSAQTYTLENIWDASDTALLAIKSASDSQAQLAIRFGFATGAKYLFTGYLGATLAPGGTALQLVTTPVVITAFGRSTILAT